MSARVWIVTEEIEVGSENGETFSILSAHTTEKGADDARDDWRGEHGADPHAFQASAEDEDECGPCGDWCLVCGWGVSVQEMELSQ